MLVLITPSSGMPVTVEEAKADWRVETDDEDVVIEQKLKAAVDFIEGQAQIAIAPTILQERFDKWKCEFDLTRSPVRDVQSVSYLDESGAEVSVDSQDYSWDRTEEGARIAFSSTFSFPEIDENRKGAIRVTFEVGFDVPGNSPALPEFTLPVKVRQAVLYLAGHWYANREAVNIGTVVQEVPLGFDRIAAQLRVFR